MNRFSRPDARVFASDRIVCLCLQVTEADLMELLTTREVSTLKDIRCHTGAGDGCMICHRELKALLERRRAYSSSSSSPSCSDK
jgi:bacterioferritin-associated ferredoxin